MANFGRNTFGRVEQFQESWINTGRISTQLRSRVGAGTMPYISLDDNHIEFRDRYFREAQIAATASMDEKALFEPTVADLATGAPRYPIDGDQLANESFWKVGKFGKGRFVLPESHNYEVAWRNLNKQIQLDIQRYTEDLWAALLTQTLPITEGPVGGFFANLGSWNDGDKVQGYDATILARQRIDLGAGSTILQTGDFTTYLLQLKDLVIGGANVFYVPQTFYYALTQSAWDRSGEFPRINLSDTEFTRSPIGAGDEGQQRSFVSYDGVPFIPIHDAIWTAAGYTVGGAVGTNNYTIVAARLNTSGNPDDNGCFVGYRNSFDPMIPADMEIALSDSTIPVGMGMNVFFGPKHITDLTTNEVVDARTMLMKGSQMFCVRHPGDAAILGPILD